MAQSIHCVTLDFNSGFGLGVVSSSPLRGSMLSMGKKKKSQANPYFHVFVPPHVFLPF